MNFEQELRNALERKEPAKGFAERVIAQAGERKESGWSWRRPYVPVAIAASLIAGVFGTVRYQEQQRGERAKEQLMLALRITAKSIGTVEQVAKRKLGE